MDRHAKEEWAVKQEHLEQGFGTLAERDGFVFIRFPLGCKMVVMTDA